MKISGIIAEYNPFHNGHKYMIDTVRKNCDAVVCVMSGSFVQRGDVAIFDKWTRTKSALLNGIDLVIELPAVFASATAERFAHGATELISSLGCVDNLFFGSECGDIKKLSEAADVLLNEDKNTSDKFQKYLKTGYSFPVARELAFKDKIAPELLNQSNNILAIEYIRALKLSKSIVKPFTLQRIGDSYNSYEISGAFASATAIRHNILKKIDFQNNVPDNLAEFYKIQTLYTADKIENVILYSLRNYDTTSLSEIADVCEGLEFRLKSAAMNSSTIPEFLEKVISKRYTKSKITRILTSVLLGIKKELLYEKIPYIRILGFNDTGRQIIKQIKKQAELPIITKTADADPNCKLLKKDIFATDVASLCSHDIKKRTGGKDYTTPPVYIKSK